MRVHQLAKELGVTSKEVMDRLLAMKIEVKGHMSALDDKTIAAVKTAFEQPKKTAQEKPHKKAAAKPVEEKTSAVKTPVVKKAAVHPKPHVKDEKPEVKAKSAPAPKAHQEKPATELKKPHAPVVRPEHKEPIPAPVAPVVEKQAPVAPAVQPAPPAADKKVLEIDFPVTVKQFAVKLGIKPNDVIVALLKKSVLVTINNNLGEDIVNMLAAEYNVEIKKAKTLEEELIKVDDDVPEKGPTAVRSPVVTFMGHVDHGKTSLLDYIKKTKVVSKEKGGITQHIGAYKVRLPKGSVTFLDTPGHEAFTAMRARGANITDIVVLVVAADDGVMPQTKEAVDHARAAGVPIVVAINKSDLPNINPDKVKRQLNELGLMPEDWGGQTIMVPVSAKTGMGVDHLLEMLLLEAEILELRAKPSIRARGVVLESKLSPGRGSVATLLVRNGTLRLGDMVLCGLYFGKIRAMVDDKGKRIEEAPPATPVEVLGVQGVAEAGDEFFVVKDEKKARTLAALKQEEKRQEALKKSSRVSLEHLYEQIKGGEIKELKIILKGDVQGSIEALSKSLESLSTSEVKLNMVHSDVGNINESDVMLAVVTNAVIIGFNSRIEPQAEEIAKKENIEIKKYDIIYDAINDVKAAMEGLLEPIEKEVFQGRAKIQQVFKVSKVGQVAGCIVVKGQISRSNPVRLMRGSTEVVRGKIKALKRFKDDVRDVGEGVECGISIERFDDYKPGDIIESFSIEMIVRRLDSRR